MFGFDIGRLLGKDTLVDPMKPHLRFLLLAGSLALGLGQPRAAETRDPVAVRAGRIAPGTAEVPKGLDVVRVGTAPSTPMSEIRRLGFAMALVDYPIEQNKFRESVGIPPEVKASVGSSELIDGKQAIYWDWPLLEGSDGRYSIKAYYSADTMETTGRNPLITGAEVVVSPLHASNLFAVDLRGFPIPQLKALLKQSGLSPKEFTAPDRFTKYMEEARRTASEAVKSAATPSAANK